MTPWSVEKCKAFPQWVLTGKVLLSPRLKGAVTSQRDIIPEEYEWFYTLPVWLTCWKWHFLGWWILFWTVIHHSGIGRSFWISPSSFPGGDPKQLIVLRSIFQSRLNGKNFLTLAEWSISKSTGSPSHGLGLCTFWLATTILKQP